MSRSCGLYGIIQFSAEPERFEFINIGVLLLDVERRFLKLRFAKSLRRIERMFGPQPRQFLAALKAGMDTRIRAELGLNWDVERLHAFVRSRANVVRISKLQSILIEDDPVVELDNLFDALVGDDERMPRLPKVTAELKRRFDSAGVGRMVEKPDPIKLPQGVTIEAPYAYHNGVYNLIDPVRLGGNPSDALAQASKRAVQGQWLRDFSIDRQPAQLVVVGEVAGQEQSFVRAIDKMMKEHQVKFYDMEHIEPLIKDIKMHVPPRPNALDLF